MTTLGPRPPRNPNRYCLTTAERALRHYLYGTQQLPAVIGLSLFNQRFSEVTESEFVYPSLDTPIAWQMPQSWGALYKGTAWSEFVDW